MLRQSSAVVCLTGLVLLIPGCSNPELPMSPSSFTAGVILYEHANFLGNSAHITNDVRTTRARVCTTMGMEMWRVTGTTVYRR
jgi:hypothetical protein